MTSREVARRAFDIPAQRRVQSRAAPRMGGQARAFGHNLLCSTPLPPPTKYKGKAPAGAREKGGQRESQSPPLLPLCQSQGSRVPFPAPGGGFATRVARRRLGSQGTVRRSAGPDVGGSGSPGLTAAQGQAGCAWPPAHTWPGPPPGGLARESCFIRPGAELSWAQLIFRPGEAEFRNAENPSIFLAGGNYL